MHLDFTKNLEKKEKNKNDDEVRLYKTESNKT